MWSYVSTSLKVGYLYRLFEFFCLEELYILPHFFIWSFVLIFVWSHGYLFVYIYIERERERDRRRQWHPTPVLLPGKSRGWRSLVGCSPWGHWGSDTTERLHFHFSLSCIGEGNGNPLQCSCLENPRRGGASWAAVYGVTESDTTEVT